MKLMHLNTFFDTIYANNIELKMWKHPALHPKKLNALPFNVPVSINDCRRQFKNILQRWVFSAVQVSKEMTPFTLL